MYDYRADINPNPKDLYFSYVINYTWMHIFELILLTFCILVHKNYPREFGMIKELAIFSVVVFCTSMLFEYGNKYMTDDANHCWLITADGWLNLVRNILFQVICVWMPVRSSSSMFPLPFTWVLKDFTAFI